MADATIQGDRVISDVNSALPKILLTIRTLESNNNYKAQSPYATASGAYQFIDSSWKQFASSVQGASQYARAKDAPPNIQDQVATLYVKSILASTGNQLAAVPVKWYYPKAWGNPAILDSIPGTGNKLTVREYAEKWLYIYGMLNGETIGDAGQRAINNIPVVSDLIDWTEAAAKFLATLMNTATWVRVAKVVGGTALLGMGLYVVSGRSVVNDVVKAAVPL